MTRLTTACRKDIYRRAYDVATVNKALGLPKEKKSKAA